MINISFSKKEMLEEEIGLSNTIIKKLKVDVDKLAHVDFTLVTQDV